MAASTNNKMLELQKKKETHVLSSSYSIQLNDDVLEKKKKQYFPPEVN